MPYHLPCPQHLLTPYRSPQPQLQLRSPTHHHKSVVEVAVEEVAVEEAEAVVEAVEAEEVAEEVAEEDHQVANLRRKLPHLLRPLTTMAKGW